jgi:sulfide:quinone oxidoreductase
MLSNVESPERTRPRVVIVGGGVAGVETLLALRDLAGDRIELSLVSPQPEFVYRPLLVEEPFNLGPAERHELEPLAREHEATFVPGALDAIDPGAHLAKLADGTELGYEHLVVCVGGRLRETFEGDAVVTFPNQDPLEMDALIGRAAEGHHHRIAFVVPPGVTWALPLYELALMTERRVREGGERAEIVLVTPEAEPLNVFGTAASAEVGALLSGRGIEIETGRWVRGVSDGSPVVAPSDELIDADVTVALAAIEGPEIDGLPQDGNGFIPIDQHARVKGVEDVWAAGDGTNFPIKQGGIGTQQADAAAEDIASRVGAPLEPQPFHPVLRGKLLTGDESLHMQQDVTGGRGEGTASADCLWWPPQKIGGRYLAAWLGHEEPHSFEAPRRTLDVEVALPKEWHEEPMAMDPTDVSRVE